MRVFGHDSDMRLRTGCPGRVIMDWGGIVFSLVDNVDLICGAYK